MSRLRSQSFWLPLLLALVLTACAVTSSPSGAHWRGVGERHVIIAIEPQPDQWFNDAITQAAASWNQSPYVEFFVRVGHCTPGENCIRVVRGDLPWPVIAQAAVGWDTALHIYGLGGTLTFLWGPWDWEIIVNAGCHEIGHALGLQHPAEGQGPCQGTPTPWDLDLVRQSHEHDDVTTFSTEAPTEGRDAPSGTTTTIIQDRGDTQ